MIYNIHDIKKTVESNTFDWFEIESKPELFQYNHYMKFYNITTIDDFNNNTKFVSTNDDIIKFLQGMVNYDLYKLGKSYLVKLEPQKYPIRQYEESDEYKDLVDRKYIAIQVSDGAKFCLNDKIIGPVPGQCFDVNPDDLYSIYNNSDTDSIYLVVDIFKN